MATALRYRAPAPVLFVIGAVSMYAGAALAVGLFTVLAPAAVAVLRMLGAAAVLLAWRRPPAAAWRGARLLRAAAFGLATAGMNIAFYEAIARLPLGTAVAVEFCGPVAVAAVASRRPRDIAAVVLAAVGVALIADVRWSGSPSGVLWALAAAALWAAYIVLGKRVAGAGNGLDDMAVGFAVAAVVLSPLLLLRGGGGRARGAGRPGRAAARGGRRRAVERGALRARPDRAAPGGAGALRGAAGVAARHRDDRRPDRAAGRCPARSKRSGSRPSWGPSRCGRGTATPPSRWADRADDHRP